MASDHIPKEYTVREAAVKLKESEVTVRNHMAKGSLGYVKRKSGTVRIPHKALVEYMGYEPDNEE